MVKSVDPLSKSDGRNPVKFLMLALSTGEPVTSSSDARWAVIFISQRTSHDPDGYAAAAARMIELAEQQPGFLGVEDTRDEAGLGITVSWWSDPDAIERWRQHAEHKRAQHHGRAEWYEWFRLQVCRVERDSEFSRQDASK